jgi:hypothetical protein
MREADEIVVAILAAPASGGDSVTSIRHCNVS